MWLRLAGQPQTTLHGRAVENGNFHPSDHSDFSREIYEGTEPCSAGVDEVREMASTIKTEVLTELKGCTK